MTEKKQTNEQIHALNVALELLRNMPLDVKETGAYFAGRLAMQLIRKGFPIQ